MKAYLLKESLDRLWSYHYEGGMLRYLQNWTDQLRWQRVKPFEELARMLLTWISHHWVEPHEYHQNSADKGT